ncbi:MAG: PQQ-dependent sugar dehydrogenase, partial [Actinomycetota bacterium]|nr:PQQ-dependent sugar dehydrogenase [Actinomycetota bacterium]
MRPRIALVAVALAAGALAPPASSSSSTNRIPPGFTVVVYANTGGTASSLAFGKDTREGADRSAQRLYVTDFVGDRVVVIDDAAGQGTTVSTFADGFSGPLGVVGGSDGSLYVADAESTRSGPFGSRPYGRVWRVRDTNGDGVADKKTVVLKDLPNGRHNTNGMAFGPDGMLYVTNGNSTDDGVEGGQPEVVPWSGSVIRVNPNAKGVSLADLPRGKTLVAYGFRNVYDLAFSPLDRSRVFIP